VYEVLNPKRFPYEILVCISVTVRPFHEECRAVFPLVLSPRLPLRALALARAHTGKTGAGSDFGAGCNVNKWVFSHAAGPANQRAGIELDKPGAGPAAGLSVSMCLHWNLYTCLKLSVPDGCFKHRSLYETYAVLRFLFLCTNIFLVQRSESN